MLLGHISVLEFADNIQLPQWLIIDCYLAYETGLSGKYNLESARKGLSIQFIVTKNWKNI